MKKHAKGEPIEWVMSVWFSAAMLVTGLAALWPEEAPAARPMLPIGDNLNPEPETITRSERHCMVITTMGEATPNHRAEAIAIMRGVLRRRELGQWGDDLCAVVTSARQYSVWNEKAMPGAPKRPSRQYLKYSQWADEALAQGPSEWDHYWHPKTMKRLYGRSKPRWASACRETLKIGAATMCRIKET